MEPVIESMLLCLASALRCMIDKLDASRLSGSARSRSCLRADASDEGFSLGHLDFLGTSSCLAWSLRSFGAGRCPKREARLTGIPGDGCTSSSEDEQHHRGRVGPQSFADGPLAVAIWQRPQRRLWCSSLSICLSSRAAERLEATRSECRSNFAIHRLIHAHCASALGRPHRLEKRVSSCAAHNCQPPLRHWNRPRTDIQSFHGA